MRNDICKILVGKSFLRELQIGASLFRQVSFQGKYSPLKQWIFLYQRVIYDRSLG